MGHKYQLAIFLYEFEREDNLFSFRSFFDLQFFENKVSTNGFYFHKNVKKASPRPSPKESSKNDAIVYDSNVDWKMTGQKDKFERWTSMGKIENPSNVPGFSNSTTITIKKTCSDFLSVSKKVILS